MPHLSRNDCTVPAASSATGITCRRLLPSSRRRVLLPSWETATSAFDPDASPRELDALSKHARTCAKLKGHGFVTIGRLHVLRNFAAARPVGTLIAVAALLWVLTW